MCIDFIDFNHDIIYGQPKDTKKNLEKLRESKRKQLLKARSKELSSNLKGKGLSALPVSLVHFFIMQLPVTCCYCKLCAHFHWFSVSSVFSVFSTLINAADQRHTTSTHSCFAAFCNIAWSCILGIKFCQILIVV